MNGVEILNETVKYSVNDGVMFFGIIMGIIALLTLLSFISSIIMKDISVGVAICFIICGLISFLSIQYYNQGKSYTEYQVIISDEVNFNEFNQKYDIVNQEGKIYTVKLKDGD